MSSWRDVHAFSQPLVLAGAPDEIVVSTPMRFANIIRLNEAGEREVVSMRWGFAGRSDKNPSRPKHMHARCETVERLPTFADAFARGRGVLVVHTFNEGEELPNGKTKQWVIAPKDRKPIAIAVLCEKWINGAEVLDTFVQVTTPANELISRITDRMPAILQSEDWSTWLGETDAASNEVKAILQTFEDSGKWTMTEQEAKPIKKPKPQKTDPQPGLF